MTVTIIVTQIHCLSVSAKNSVLGSLSKIYKLSVLNQHSHIAVSAIQEIKHEAGSQEANKGQDECLISLKVTRQVLYFLYM